MNTRLAESEAANIRSWAHGFPYVNGGLFGRPGSADVPVGTPKKADEDVGAPSVPRFSKIARSYLLHAGNLDWKKINPDIFGSMIQAVADDEERCSLGLYYTRVSNILKVLNPLLLDELRARLAEASDNPRKLLHLRQRLARIRVFDPACGSGNFLVIAYKELRAIEAEINCLRGDAGRPSDIPVTNFRGIELRHFSCEIAHLALIIAEYQCDVLYRGQKLALLEFRPLETTNWITCDNALRSDWLSVCPPTGKAVKIRGDELFDLGARPSPSASGNADGDGGAPGAPPAGIDFKNEGGETYICGNPPYLGSTWQSDEQKSDRKRIFDGRTKSWKSLDYVAGWFMKAADFGTQTPSAAAFVSTNSICQGQQVAILWPLVFETGHVIHFAHTSFKWANLASHNSGVTVPIVAICNQPAKMKRLIIQAARYRLRLLRGRLHRQNHPGAEAEGKNHRPHPQRERAREHEGQDSRGGAHPRGTGRVAGHRSENRLPTRQTRRRHDPQGRRSGGRRPGQARQGFRRVEGLSAEIQPRPRGHHHRARHGQGRL